MEGKPIYSLFPHPISPNLSTQSHRPHHSRNRKTRTSLDPLPPIEEPPHSSPAPKSALPESPVLKPIHSLYNPQPARPSSNRGASERYERRRSLNRQLQSSQKFPLDQRDLSFNRNLPLHSQQAQPLSRTSSIEDSSHPSQHTATLSDSSPHPLRDQGMYVGGPSLTLRAQVPTPSTSSSVSLAKPPILSPTSTVVSGKPFPSTQASNQAQYNKTPYFHGGIGGRGNYRKVRREDKSAPLAYAPNARPLNERRNFLSNFFWGRGKRKRSPSDGERTDGQTSEDSMSGRGSRGSSEREEVALGAAEVMRRKLLRQAGVRSYRRVEAWERN